MPGFVLLTEILLHFSHRLTPVLKRFKSHQVAIERSHVHIQRSIQNQPIHLHFFDHRIRSANPTECLSEVASAATSKSNIQAAASQQ
jgi:hypothetical protein